MMNYLLFKTPRPTTSLDLRTTTTVRYTSSSLALNPSSSSHDGAGAESIVCRLGHLAYPRSHVARKTQGTLDEASYLSQLYVLVYSLAGFFGRVESDVI